MDANLFKFHKLNEDGQRRAKRIGGQFEDLLTNLEITIPPGRELSIVTTKLEEACFFAKKGIAVQKENQEKF